MPKNVGAEIRSSVPATMPARGTIARGPMAGRRRGKDARSIEFHDWLRREPRFCVQPTGRSGSDSGGVGGATYRRARSEEHTSELQSLMRISYAVFCLKKKKSKKTDA